ncbi:MAG: hypothetical protein ACFCGT_25615 [Sandaracinaceae bacterium]
MTMALLAPLRFTLLLAAVAALLSTPAVGAAQPPREGGDSAPAEGSTTDGDAPADGEPAEGSTTDGAPTDGEPAEGSTTDGAPADGAPADDAPADDAPADGAPADDAPAGQAHPPEPPDAEDAARINREREAGAASPEGSPAELPDAPAEATEAEPETEPADEAPAQPDEAWEGAASPREGMEAEGHGTPIDDGARRELPDYDGRGLPPVDVYDPWLWIPRVLFAPVYFLAEYVIRRPLTAAVTELEKSPLWEVIKQAFEPGPIGFVPTLFFDFGFQPSFGVYFFWNDVPVTGNNFRIFAGTFGAQWIRVDAVDRIVFDDRTELSFQYVFWRRPDYIYHGIAGETNSDNNDILQSARSRYRSVLMEGNSWFYHRPWRASEIRVTAGVRYQEFDNSDFNNRGILDAVAEGLYDLPPGFVEGYFAFRYRLEGAIDNRLPRPAPGSGMRLGGFFEQAFDIEDPNRQHWLKYGGDLALFWDVGSQRVFELATHIEFADPVNGEVPFTELVLLGDDALLLGGFLPGQLRGRSAAVVTVAYRYPIWVWLDATAFIGVGNAFSAQLGNFDIGRNRLSFGLGFRTVGDRDNSGLLALAFGTDTFERGTSITSVRFVFGSEHGF